MKAIVTGGSSGLGMQIKTQLQACGVVVYDWSRETGVDVTDVASIWKAIDALPAEVLGRLDILVNCAGVNHIDWFPELTEDDWDRLMNTNARSIFSVSRLLLPYLIHGTICNIVSNASHMPMTHSAAYNASKGAAHILTLQMARELKKTHDITVFGVSPNKLKGTGMSQYIEKRVCELRGWTPEQAAEYQKTALPSGEETTPEAVGEFIAFLLSTKARHQFLNGVVMPYGA